MIGNASEDLKGKIGPGFVIYGPSFRSCHPECGKRDLSLIWQTPNESMKERVKKRETNLEEQMRVHIASFLESEERDSELPTSREVRAVGRLDRSYKMWTVLPCTHTTNGKLELS